jgi:hypothetical protein
MIKSPTLIPTAEVTGIWLDPAGTGVLGEVIMVVVVVVAKHELEHSPHFATMNSPVPSTFVEHHGVE